MRVTGDMLDRAVAVMNGGGDLQDSLEAALTDVPEPELRGARITAIHLDETRAIDAEARVKELEAKLVAAESKLDRVANLAMHLPEGGTGDAILAVLGLERTR